MGDDEPADDLELRERRLADRVTERVRPALFRTYAIAGGAVAAVLAYVGLDVLADARDGAEKFLREQVEHVETTVATAIANAHGSLAESQRDLQEERRKIDVLHGELNQRKRQIDEILAGAEAQLRAFDAKARQIALFAGKIDELDGKIRQIEERNRELQGSTEKALSTTRNLGDVTAQLDSLAAEVKRLGAAVENPGNRDDLREIVDSVSRVQTAVQSTQQRVTDDLNRPTVWFQFAGATREAAQDFARALREYRYVVPGEERVAAAGNRREVRYFHPEDAEAAARLAADATSTLRDLGYRAEPPVAARPLLSFAGPKPPVGVVELWLELAR